MTHWRISKPYIAGVCDVTHETDCPLEAAYAFIRGWRVELVDDRDQPDGSRVWTETERGK